MCNYIIYTIFFFVFFYMGVGIHFQTLLPIPILTLLPIMAIGWIWTRENWSHLYPEANIFQALSVATNVENKGKNGSDSILPFDRNRVILTPDGARYKEDIKLNTYGFIM